MLNEQSESCLNINDKNNIDNDIDKDKNKNNNNDHDNDQCNTSINSIHQPM